MATAPTRVSPDDVDTQVYPDMFEDPVLPEPEPLDDGSASQLRRDFQHAPDVSSWTSLPSATSLEPSGEVSAPEPPQEAS